jgi:multidrug efflux pump subunit AcrA (membrane-fusion protein)
MTVAWSCSVAAYNTAVDSTNKMHDDAVARTYGFRGGLVPGVDVWAYMTQPCIDRWGAAFLTGSTMEARFVSPVYDGEIVDVTLDGDGDGDGDGTVTVVGHDGTVRATGTASVSDPPPPVVAIASAPCPLPVPPASRSSLAVGTVLGTLTFTYRREHAVVYLREVRDDHAIYEDGAVCHPGFLARQANAILHRNVVLGPWIHVGTRAHHRGLVRDGDRVEVRGRVAAEYERKGHRLVDLDVEVTADGEPVWSAFHTAIWQPRRT